MIDEAKKLLEPIRRLHERVRDQTLAACERAAVEDLSQVETDEMAGDTIYAIDRVSEAELIAGFAEIARLRR